MKGRTALPSCFSKKGIYLLLLYLVRLSRCVEDKAPTARRGRSCLRRGRGWGRGWGLRGVWSWGWGRGLGRAKGWCSRDTICPNGKSEKGYISFCNVMALNFLALPWLGTNCCLYLQGGNTSYITHLCTPYGISINFVRYKMKPVLA